MCGIYGCVSLTIGESDLAVNLHKLDHRGPDNQDYYYSRPIFLGHTRLSIIDLDSSANQPYCDDCVLIFNGEIYNYLELAKKHLGQTKFKTHSDTEILFEVLKKAGSKILPELNGMFAFAFYNKKKKTILLARDSSGIKPLYYRLCEGEFEFASEIKSLKFAVDSNKIKDFLSTGSFQYSYLPYSNIEILSGGHYAEFFIDSKTLKIEKFNKLEDQINSNVYFAARNTGFKAKTNELDNLLQKSIEMHLVGDAKLGALCSGGVDSSLISAMASYIKPDISLYHAGVEGSGGEEDFAEKVSKHLKKDIFYIKVSEETYWKEFAYLTYISDLPIYHPNDVSLHYIAKKAFQNKVKVLLSGEGADELFGGYIWHQNLLNRKKKYDFFDSHPFLKKISKRLCSTFSLNGLHDFDSQDYINFMPTGLGYADLNLGLIAKSCSFSMMEFEVFKKWQEHLSLYKFETDYNSFGLSLIFNNLYGHLGSILHRTDRILMANSIEGRVPFLENDIIKFAVNLPLEHKINRSEGKFILKKVAERYLPKEVIYRPKMGFPVPWANYIGKIKKIFENGFLSELTGFTCDNLFAIYRNDPYLKFRFIALEVWGRLFVRGESYKDICVE